MFYVRNHLDESQTFASPLSSVCLWYLNDLHTIYKSPDVALVRDLVITEVGKPRFSFACSVDEFTAPLRRFTQIAEKMGLSTTGFGPSFVTIERRKNRLFWQYQIGKKSFWLTLDGRAYHLSDGLALARVPQQILSLAS